jgi:hypothetical protein
MMVKKDVDHDVYDRWRMEYYYILIVVAKA